MSVTVTTQAELDRALADREVTIYIGSPDGVWLRIGDTDPSHVEARGSSHVVAWGSSHVEAWDSSHVVARDSSHVEAWDSSHVEAWDSSHVVARGSSHVVAWGSSHVEAGRYASVHLHSQRVAISGGVVIDMTGLDLCDVEQWLDYHGVTVTEDPEHGRVATVYKAVNNEWTTDRGTIYAPGDTPEAPDWEATRVCGQGLHFGPSTRHSRQYLPDATRYVRCGVRVDEMVALDDKCKARRVVVPCVEVDEWGREVAS